MEKPKEINLTDVALHPEKYTPEERLEALKKLYPAAVEAIKKEKERQNTDNSEKDN